jgi:hypothetical protein
MPIARPPQGFDMGSLTEAEKALLAERALFTKGEQGWVGGWVVGGWARHLSRCMISSAHAVSVR